MQPIQLNQLAAFFDGFRSVSEDADAAEYAHLYPAFFNGFRSRMQALQAQHKLYTPKYNLFEILRIAHRETITHTPFLFNLLNPSGSHAQGHLFVYSLLQKIYHVPINPLLSTVDEVIENKATTGLGYIDIFLRGKLNAEPFALIIENKIYAGDQPQQLERYYEYVSKVLGYTDSQIRMLYLTINGTRPSIPHSISQSKFNRLSGNAVLQLWSYNKDVRCWLESCLAEIHEQSLLHGSIQQYIDILKTWKDE